LQAYSKSGNLNASNSWYHDWSLGSSIEAGKDLLPWDTLKAAVHYRRDTHNEANFYFSNPQTGDGTGCTANVVCYTAPVVSEFEDTYSTALENTAHVWNHIDLVQGFSYEWRNTLQARGFNGSSAPYGVIYYPNSYAAAPNGQLAAIWHYNDTDKVYLTFSDRTRFPTLFERYSTKFGLAIANAGLKPERAANVQLGWEGFIAPRVKVEADAYFSDVQDMIQSVNITLSNGKSTTQSQNVGHGHILGADLKADWAVTDDLAVGGHASLIHRWVNLATAITPNVQLVGVPGVTALFYAQWRLLPSLTLTPNVQIAGQRWSSNAANTGYVLTGAYTLVNLNAEWRATDSLTLTAGAKNLTDRLYVLTDGYPEPGRTFYLGARYTF
jgi:iron complex outermembrane receptor protein